LPEEARDAAKAIKAAIEGFISDMTFELQQEPSVGNLAGTQIQHGARIIAIRPSGYRKSRQVLSSVKAIKRCRVLVSEQEIDRRARGLITFDDHRRNDRDGRGRLRSGEEVTALQSISELM
jgi:hypothetical protein